MHKKEKKAVSLGLVLISRMMFVVLNMLSRKERSEGGFRARTLPKD